jgi:hypothetical protein
MAVRQRHTAPFGPVHPTTTTAPRVRGPLTYHSERKDICVGGPVIMRRRHVCRVQYIMGSTLFQVGPCCMDRSRNPEKGCWSGVQCRHSYIQRLPEIIPSGAGHWHLCRTYQIPLTDIVARPSPNEWIFTRFLDCPTSQYCNRLQKVMNSPGKPDRDNRVELASMPGAAHMRLTVLGCM